MQDEQTNFIMPDAHIHRILALLGAGYQPEVWDSREWKYYKKFPSLSYQYNYAQFPWKRLFKDIGKQVCISALLPFAETALHVSQTPLPDQDIWDIESYDSLREKIDLVTAWAAKPTKEKKMELAKRLPPKITSSSKNYGYYGMTTKVAESFINSLIEIIVIERKFQTRVSGSLGILSTMGYGSPLSIFTSKIIAIYRERLKDQESLNQKLSD